MKKQSNDSTNISEQGIIGIRKDGFTEEELDRVIRLIKLLHKWDMEDKKKSIDKNIQD